MDQGAGSASLVIFGGRRDVARGGAGCVGQRDSPAWPGSERFEVLGAGEDPRLDFVHAYAFAGLCASAAEPMPTNAAQFSRLLEAEPEVAQLEPDFSLYRAAVVSAANEQAVPEGGRPS